jgi:apolipoprotein N-acyltransferase
MDVLSHQGGLFTQALAGADPARGATIRWDSIVGPLTLELLCGNRAVWFFFLTMEITMNTIRLPLPRWFSLLALLIAFVLLRFSIGLRVVPTFTWLFPVFMMAWVRSNKPGWGLLLCWVSSILAVAIIILPVGFMWGGQLISWMIAGIVGSLWSVPFAVDRLISHRVSGILSTLAFPVSWVTVEYLSSFSPFMGTAFVLALTQFDFPLITQISSVTGIWGISFLVVWLAPVVCLTLEHRFEWPRVSFPISLFLVVLLAVLCFGGIELGLNRPTSPTVRVAGVTASSRDGTLESGVSLLNTYVPQAAAAGARIVMLHEGAIFITAEDESALMRLGQEQARQEGVYLLLGLQVEDEDRSLPYENKILFIAPDGELLSEYLKQDLVPGEVASFVRGEESAPVLETPHGNIAILICSDTFSPDLVRRQVGRSGADILLVPAWDFQGVEFFWSYGTAFRAIENGFAMFRVARESVTIAVDYQGRPVVLSNYFLTDQSIIYADLATEGRETAYSLLGDWFAFLSVVGFVVLLVIAFAKRKFEEK